MSANSFFKHINHIPEVPILSNYKFESIVDLPKNIHVHDFETKNNPRSRSAIMRVFKKL